MKLKIFKVVRDNFKYRSGRSLIDFLFMGTSNTISTEWSVIPT